jgi:hypothetical protein
MGRRFGRSPSGVVQRSRRSQEIRKGALGLPAKCKRHLACDRLQHLRVVLDARLTGDRENNGVGRPDTLGVPFTRWSLAKLSRYLGGD